MMYPVADMHFTTRLFKAWSGVLLLLLLATPANTQMLMLGNSITAGYGLPNDQSLTVQFEVAVRQKFDNPKIAIINTGVSGETTAGRLAHLQWWLDDQPDSVIIALGGNDTLLGLKPSASESNLQKILQTLKKRNIPAFLAGMHAPHNLGDGSTTRLDAISPALAAEQKVLFYPFLLKGVATVLGLNQPGGIHLNPQGVTRVIKGILPLVEQLIQQPRKVAS